jgi:hypothetical protein
MGFSTASEIIDLRNPNLSTAQTAQKTDMIGLATEQLDATVYGTKIELAIALLVLHWFEVQNRTGSGGPLSSETEGGLSRSYAVTASSSDWGSTSWGQELQSLTNAVVFAPRNRMMT